MSANIKLISLWKNVGALYNPKGINEYLHSHSIMKKKKKLGIPKCYSYLVLSSCKMNATKIPRFN